MVGQQREIMPGVEQTGYSVKGARPHAHKMLTNADIQAAQSNAPQPRLIVLIVSIKCIV